MGPLTGLKVVEMTGLAPAPYCGMLLADLGADVIRIERPGAIAAGPDPKFDLLKRNRQTIEMDLKSRADVETVQRLINRADALIEGFRPGVMERLGLGPEVFQASNPKLVYGRVTGWGQEGPVAQAAGHDVNYIAITGVLHLIGRKDGPPVIPLNLIGDFAGGGLMLAFGILAAIYEAAHSGTGQVVDAAMIDGAASLMTYLYGARAMGRMQDTRGEALSGSAPQYTVYETKDGHYMSVAATEQQFYAEFLQRIGIEDPESLPSRADQANWPPLRERFEAIFRTKTRAEWCALLEGTDACVSPVLGMDEAPNHPHNRARGTFIEVDGVTQPAPAPRFGRTPAARPVFPRQGHLDAATIKRWGLDESEVQVS